MMAAAHDAFGRAVEAGGRLGLLGLVRAALNRALVRWAALDVVHVMLLDRASMTVPAADPCYEMRFLTADEVRRFATNPVNHLPSSFADRAAGGADLCFAALHGDRIASYGWYAIHSIEPEHAAGTALGLPDEVAYMYKGFTHPDYRGQRLYGACMGRALTELGNRGVTRLVAFVYWHNTASLKSCEHLGYRRLGLLWVGRNGPVHVPAPASRAGVTFGSEAAAEVDLRRPGSAAPA